MSTASREHGLVDRRIGMVFAWLRDGWPAGRTRQDEMEAKKKCAYELLNVEITLRIYVGEQCTCTPFDIK